MWAEILTSGSFLALQACGLSSDSKGGPCVCGVGRLGLRRGSQHRQGTFLKSTGSHCNGKGRGHLRPETLRQVICVQSKRTGRLTAGEGCKLSTCAKKWGTPTQPQGAKQSASRLNDEEPSLLPCAPWAFLNPSPGLADSLPWHSQVPQCQKARKLKTRTTQGVSAAGTVCSPGPSASA